MLGKVKFCIVSTKRLRRVCREVLITTEVFTIPPRKTHSALGGGGFKVKLHHKTNKLKQSKITERMSLVKFNQAGKFLDGFKTLYFMLGGEDQ